MIAIIDSGGANIASVRFALERLGVDGVLTADPAVISAAERVILPGVGAAPVAMAQLARAGLVECICGLTQPVLGICLGMQLLFERSEEGDTPLLGLVGGTCSAFDPSMGLTVPHMGCGAGFRRYGCLLQLWRGFHRPCGARQFHGGAVPPRTFRPGRGTHPWQFSGTAGWRERLT